MINDITDIDIAELTDTDLRELIGKLCEATLNKNNIDTMCLTYGGVNVRVKSSAKFNEDWLIPRNNTIIQVKKPSMLDSAIIGEMTNKDGDIKDCIKELNNRQIVPNRGNMRAILPHVISNRLADEILSSMPIDFLIILKELMKFINLYKKHMG